VAVVSGPAFKLLQAERILLNMLIRCCSISTLAKSYRDLADSMNWKGDIAGTRKTTPGFRIIEKYALLVGGCVTHRYVRNSTLKIKGCLLYVHVKRQSH
jgi:nicotinate-nucleotide pyrophosphorylase (carboxylating)